MGKRGRPTYSQIRQNIIEILSHVGRAYGYELHKHYVGIFPRCTRESVYYHLKKGVLLGQFKLVEVKQEQGDYSWGRLVEKRYYCLGENALSTNDPRVREFFNKKAVISGQQ